MDVPAKKDLIAQLRLPPGFRFFPTDEELLVQYLCRKVTGREFSLRVIADVDLYKFDPWVLPSKALFGEKEWYFFSPRDRKYPNGSRPNRVAGCGYWKATGTDKVVMSQGRKVGIKKSLVFYVGRAPKGSKTNWIMHEFRLFNSPRSSCSSKLDDWVLCRIYMKNSGVAAKSTDNSGGSYTSSDGSGFAVPRMNSSGANQVGCEDDEKVGVDKFGSGSWDWGVLAGLVAGPAQGVNGPGPAHGQLGGHAVNDGSGTCVPSLVPMWAQGYSNSADPFGVNYPEPNPVTAFGFSQ